MSGEYTALGTALGAGYGTWRWVQRLALAEVLDRFLEAAGRVAQWRALAPIERACARALAAAFRLQGRVFLNNWEPTGDWEAAFDRAVAETHERFRDAQDRAVEGALAAGIRYVVGAMQPAAESLREAEPIAVLFGAQFDLANPRAVAYIEQRGAALVAAHETTREYIRTVISQGVAEGWSYDRMAKRITERYREFAVGRPQKHIDSRAHGIAVTEARNAYVEGKAIVAQRLQAAGLDMEKRWVTMGDDRVSAICQANGDVGWIPLNDTFPSGHAQPLAHPYCRCGYEVRRVGSESEDAGAETEPHVLGYTWNREPFETVAAARAAGEAEGGWDKHESTFKDEYLTRFELEDDLERTIGLWDTPEPSFNARVVGDLKRILAMAKAWGADYKQDAVAVLLPDMQGTGGRLVWDLGRKLRDEELDTLLAAVASVNENLAGAVARQHGLDEFTVGLTVRQDRIVEFWVEDETGRMAGTELVGEAIAIAGLQVTESLWRGGYAFRLLFKGSDY